MKKIKVISCIVSVALMALIFFFSSQPADMSSTVSGSITEKIIAFIIRLFDIPASDADNIYSVLHFFVRKTAHFVLFFALGASYANTVSVICNVSTKKVFIIALLLSVAYAISDEIHQLSVSGRDCKVGDVIIDSSGALSGIGLFLSLRGYILRRKSND